MAEEFFEDRMAKYFPVLMKNNNSQIQETLQASRRINIKKTPKNISKTAKKQRQRDSETAIKK